MPQVSISLCTISISIEEVHEALVSLDAQKLPVSPKILQNCADALCGPRYHLFTQSLSQAYLPSCWEVLPLLYIESECKMSLV